MKKTKGILALLVVIALCIGIFAGCGTSTPTYDDDDTIGDLSDSSDNDTLTDDAEDIIGEVIYVDTSYFSVSAYESDCAIDDYASLDIDTLTDTGITEYVYPDSSAEYYIVSDGALLSASFDDVLSGCLIAVTTDDYGTQQIILLRGAEDVSSDSVDDTNVTDEATDIIAEVTAINDDGTLELSLYEVWDETVEITDYASVDLTNYYDSYMTQTYTIMDDAVVAVAADGVLTEVTSEEIVAGDFIVVHIDDEGITNITVYHTEEDSTT